MVIMYKGVLSDYARKILFHQGVENGKCKVKHISPVRNHRCICNVALRNSLTDESLWQILSNTTLSYYMTLSSCLCAIFVFNPAFLKHVTETP